MSSEPIAVVEVVVNDEAYLRAFRVHRGVLWMIVTTLAAVCGLTMLACGLVLLGDANKFPALVFIALGATFMTALVLKQVYENRSIRKQLAQMGKSQENVTYEVYDDILRMRSSEGETRVPWGKFLKWKEGKGLILAYRSSRFFNMIPVDQMDAAVAEAIRQRLDQHVRRA
jgi:hypothetical protein